MGITFHSDHIYFLFGEFGGMYTINDFDNLYSHLFIKM